MILSVFFLNGCQTDRTAVTMDDVLHDYRVDLLKDAIYYYPANTPFHEKDVIQPLKPFDLIFEGNNPGIAPNGDIGGALIPGIYTHMLMYLGKDSDGYAYGIEMNAHKDPDLVVKVDGTVHVDGQLYVYCLGRDFDRVCPSDESIQNVVSHGEHSWAKRLASPLHQKVLKHRVELLNTVKKDLQNAFPFQIPLKITYWEHVIDLINDGRIHGADCAEYLATLFETTAGVCMDNIYMDASGLTDYFMHDPLGQQVYLAGKYNPFGDQDLYIADLLSQGKYTIRDNFPRQTVCSDQRQVIGIPVPQKVFYSPSLVTIPEKVLP